MMSSIKLEQKYLSNGLSNIRKVRKYLVVNDVKLRGCFSIMDNYLSLKGRELNQRKIFSCFSLKGEALNHNFSVKNYEVLVAI